jgi:uncharacterized protein
MRLSQHNIIVTARNSGHSYIINLLTGHADRLEPTEAELVSKGIIPSSDDFITKGYATEETEEAGRFRNAYLDFIDNRDSDEVQLFFIPTYGCNFSCSYCYQSGYQNASETLDEETIDSFFDYIKKNFAHRDKYITLFGGEPLLISPAHHKAISYFLERNAIEKIPLAVVTNGYYVEEYLDLLLTNTIKEIQVTLDGTASMHNIRRRLRSGEPTFEKIVKGIDKVLKAGMPVNLRMVVDRENINLLPELAKFAVQKGWTRNPLFKTQLGRNYELHYCQDVPEKLMNRVELWEQVYQLVLLHPEVAEFHKPAFSVAKFLAENGELPSPLFDSCPGCKTEWAFDYTGRIYSCTATAGKIEESLGTFYPVVSLKKDTIAEWENRDVLSIPECANCTIQLACGGGCASVSKNKSGRLLSPDCRPVKELLEMGMEYYFPNE